MTNREILDFVASIQYASLYISLSPYCKVCGPGRDRWEHDLSKLNDVERFLLSARIKRHLNSSVKEEEAR